MTKFLKKNLAVILGATIVAGFVAVIDGGEVVRAETACSKDLSKKLNEEEVSKMNLDELEACSEKLHEDLLKEIDACTSGGECDPEKQDIISTNETTVEKQLITKKYSTAPIKDYAEHILNISDISEKLCYDATNPEEEYLKYATVIEEPIESDLTNTTKFRNCVRNTFCIDREDKPGTECVTFLRKAGEGSCSAKAIEYTKGPQEKGKASIYCQQVQLILSDSGTDLIYAYVGGLYRWAASIIGMIAVLVMVISGIQISAATSSNKRKKQNIPIIRRTRTSLLIRSNPIHN